MSLGLTEIVLILVVILLLFGGKRIPELAKALGKAKHEFTRAKDMVENETKDFKDANDNAAKEEENKSRK